MRNDVIDQIGQFIFKSVVIPNGVLTMATSTCSLVEQFDDIVAATDVLCAGIEGGKHTQSNISIGEANLND